MMSWSGLVLAQTVENVRQLPNGDWLLTINGEHKLAVSPEKAKKLNDSLDELGRLRDAMPIAQAEIAALKEVITSKDAQIKTGAEQLSNQTRISQNWQHLFEGERDLRVSAMQIVNKGAGSTWDRWYVKIPLAVGPSIASSFLRPCR